MNERIKKLAERAGVDIRHIEKHADEEFGDNLEKFVELLLKECVEIVEPCKCGCNDGSEEVYTTLTNTAVLIKRHFGIEK